MRKSEMVRVAYCSRLLLRSEREYEDEVGVKGATLRRNLGDEWEAERYFVLLDKVSLRLTGRTLEAVVTDYVVASEVWHNIDWGARKDARARRRFLRMMFRLAAMSGLPLTDDEKDRFRITDSDPELLETFYPEGLGGRPSICITYLILFGFGIMKPWEPTKERGFDLTDEEIAGSLGKLRELIMQLKEDLPTVGAFEKPLVFDQWVAIIDNHLADPELFSNCTPYGLMNALEDVVSACNSITDPERSAKSAESMISIPLPGIWVDNADRGETRFWIFPYNIRYALCYYRYMNGWRLRPYQFMGQDTDAVQFSESCYFVTPMGCADLIKGVKKAENVREVAHAGYRLELSEENGEPVRVDFYKRSLAIPDWFDWSGFQRLNPEDERYGEFREALDLMYKPGNDYYVVFYNEGAELTDVMNNLVARDFETLYVWDYPRPARFFITEIEPGSDYFVYDNSYNHSSPSFSLRKIEPSEAHPLYAIPLRRAAHTEEKREVESGNPRVITEAERARMEARKAQKEAWLAYLERVLKESGRINVGVVFHFEKSRYPVLLFPELGATFPLDSELLEEYGVERITRREDFFG